MPPASFWFPICAVAAVLAVASSDADPELDADICSKPEAPELGLGLLQAAARSDLQSPKDSGLLELLRQARASKSHVAAQAVASAPPQSSAKEYSSRETPARSKDFNSARKASPALVLATANEDASAPAPALAALVLAKHIQHWFGQWRTRMYAATKVDAAAQAAPAVAAAQETSGTGTSGGNVFAWIGKIKTLFTPTALSVLATAKDESSTASQITNVVAANKAALAAPAAGNTKPAEASGTAKPTETKGASSSGKPVVAEIEPDLDPSNVSPLAVDRPGYQVDWVNEWHDGPPHTAPPHKPRPTETVLDRSSTCNVLASTCRLICVISTLLAFVIL